MATTTKVIVQIHERTTEVQIDADLQSREIGFISTTNVLRFQENDGTNHNVWMQDSSGVTFDNNVALSAEAYINTRVGINNTNPSSISHADADNVVVGNSSTTNNGLSIISSTLATLAFGDAADDNVGRLTYSHSSNAMAFTTNGTFAVIIDSSQSVGIGNTTPSSESNANADELVVGSNANANSGITIASSTLATIAFGDTADDNIGSITYSHSSNAMSLTTNTVSAVFIDSSQNVGINDITPSYKLDVNGTGRFVGDVDFDGNISVDDNKRIYLGTSNDAELYYNGTDLIINPIGDLKVIQDVLIDGTKNLYFNANGLAGQIDHNGTDFNFKNDAAGDIVFSVGAVEKLDVKVNGVSAFKVDGNASLITTPYGVSAGQGSFSSLVTLSDSAGLVLGAGTDSKIHYDGTDLLINPQIVGTGDTRLVNGDLVIADTDQTSGLSINAGLSTSTLGQATLTGGTVTINNTNIATTDRIFLSRATTGGTEGHLSFTVSASTSFTINSSSGADTSVIDYFIIHQI